jgi:hypothetical protein
MDSPLASWIKQPLTNNQEPPIKRTHFHANKVNCGQNIQANRMNSLSTMHQKSYSFNEIATGAPEKQQGRQQGTPARAVYD